MDVVVLYAAVAPPAVTTGGATMRRYTTPQDAVDALAIGAAVVLVSDGIAERDVATVAGAVAASRATVIEVRAAGWDGQTPSPLSAACRGVISGFGERGVVRAVELLRREQAKA